MAALDFMYAIDFAATGSVETICQFLAPTNQRVTLHRVELIPEGATGATAPLKFDLSLQDGAGTSADDSAALQKDAPVAVETIQTTVRDTFTVEPSTSTPKNKFSLHQQGARTWVPRKPIVIEGGTRLACRYLSSLTVNCTLVFHLEE